MAKKNTKVENDVTEKEQTTEYQVVATFYDKHTNRGTHIRETFIFDGRTRE